MSQQDKPFDNELANQLSTIDSLFKEILADAEEARQAHANQMSTIDSLVKQILADEEETRQGLERLVRFLRKLDELKRKESEHRKKFVVREWLAFCKSWQSKHRKKSPRNKDSKSRSG